MQIHDPGTLGFDIQEMYVIVSYDDTGEGIMGGSIGGQWMPFVSAKLDNILKCAVVANQICEQTNKKYRILKFSGREVVQV